MSHISYNPPRIRLRKPGKLANTTYANEIATAVNDSNPPFSTGVDKGEYFAPFSFLAKIWDAGPAGEANYTDERYWCKPQLVKTGLSTASADTDDDHSITVDSIVTATNYEERQGAVGTGTHALPKSFVVRVFAEQDAGLNASSAPKTRYVFSASLLGSFYCTCTEDGTGADGTKTTAATWKYTVTLPNGTTKTSIDNVRPRKNGKTTKATAGWGAFTSAGTFVFDAFEKPTTVGC